MTEAFTAGIMIFIQQFRARWPWSIDVLESCWCRHLLPKSQRLPFSGFLPLNVSSPAVGDIFRSGRCRGSQTTMSSSAYTASYIRGACILLLHDWPQYACTTYIRRSLGGRAHSFLRASAANTPTATTPEDVSHSRGWNVEGRNPENGRRRDFGRRRWYRQSGFQHTDRPRPSSPELLNKYY